MQKCSLFPSIYIPITLNMLAFLCFIQSKNRNPGSPIISPRRLGTIDNGGLWKSLLWQAMNLHNFASKMGALVFILQNVRK